MHSPAAHVAHAHVPSILHSHRHTQHTHTQQQVPEEVAEQDGVLQVPCNFDAVVYDNLSRVADADVLSTTVADAARSLSALDAREALLRDSLEQLEGLVEVRLVARTQHT